MDMSRGSQEHLPSRLYNTDVRTRKRSRHSTLRDLLDTENSHHLKNLATGCCSTYWGNHWGNVPSQGYMIAYHGECDNSPCDNGNAYSGYYHHRYWFCAPPGTTHITFELWGGGGTGGGGCCCQQGPPGGAGAYAIKTLCACIDRCTGEPFAGSSLGGMCYEIYVGTTACCATCCKGTPGCKSYVLGCGLCNFCADGGMPGKVCCYVYWNGRSCSTDGGKYSARGAQEDQCLNQYRPCYPMACSGMYTFHPCELAYDCDCSCYYGADWGVGGKLGWFRSDCCETNQCFTKLGVPYPGGMGRLGGRCNGWVVERNWGDSCASEGAWCNSGPFVGHCYQLGHSVPGKGGMPGNTCGGPCCQGVVGSAGLVRVHYF